MKDRRRKIYWGKNGAKGRLQIVRLQALADHGNTQDAWEELRIYGEISKK
jgi:hypothetical protein